VAESQKFLTRETLNGDVTTINEITHAVGSTQLGELLTLGGLSKPSVTGM